MYKEHHNMEVEYILYIEAHFSIKNHKESDNEEKLIERESLNKPSDYDINYMVSQMKYISVQFIGFNTEYHPISCQLD